MVEQVGKGRGHGVIVFGRHHDIAVGGLDLRCQLLQLRRCLAGGIGKMGFERLRQVNGKRVDGLVMRLVGVQPA